MFFEIDFNRENDDRVIELLGATQSEKAGFVYYKINVDSFEDLQELLDTVDDLKDDSYSAVISFDPPTIFLDTDV